MRPRACATTPRSDPPRTTRPAWAQLSDTIRDLEAASPPLRRARPPCGARRAARTAVLQVSGHAGGRRLDAARARPDRPRGRRLRPTSHTRPPRRGGALVHPCQHRKHPQHPPRHSDLHRLAGPPRTADPRARNPHPTSHPRQSHSLPQRPCRPRQSGGPGVGITQLQRRPRCPVPPAIMPATLCKSSPPATTSRVAQLLDELSSRAASRCAA